jgi:hypothetical protein
MATLFDKLSALRQTPAPLASEQQSIQNVLGAKSGKAPTSTGPRATNLGEQAAQANVSAALGQQSQQAGMATTAQKLESQQSAEGFQLAKDDQANRSALAGDQLQLRQDELLGGLRRSEKELEFRKDAAKIEQAGIELALANKKYLADLELTGKQRRLESDLGFREEMTRLVLGDNLDALMEDIGWRTEFNAKERDWTEQLAMMDLDYALALAEASIRDENARTMFEGATGTAKSALDMGARYFGSSTTTPTPGPGNSGVQGAGKASPTPGFN